MYIIFSHRWVFCVDIGPMLFLWQLKESNSLLCNITFSKFLHASLYYFSYSLDSFNQKGLISHLTQFINPTSIYRLTYMCYNLQDTSKTLNDTNEKVSLQDWKLLFPLHSFSVSVTTPSKQIYWCIVILVYCISLTLLA